MNCIYCNKNSLILINLSFTRFRHIDFENFFKKKFNNSL